MTPAQPLSSPHPPFNLSGDEDNEQNEDDSQGVGESQGEGENPTTTSKDPVFDLDSVINPESPFLRGILSDTQILSTSGEDTTPTVTTGPVRVETEDREPTEDDWENI